VKPNNKPPKNPFTAVALCATGAEKALSNELRKLDLPITDTGFGRVRFSADLPGLYSSLMGLRTADRVLLELGFFQSMDFDSLFEGTWDVPWEQLIPRGMGITVVKVRSNRSQLRAETSIQSVVHKAVAERLCSRYKINRLPEGADASAQAEIRVYVEKDMVSLLLDLSGEPLFKRGYRTEGGVAPLRETTAAALLLLSGWKRKYPLYDPFCGSGTILIEAAMYAWDMAPGLGRSFAIGNLLIADRQTEETVREGFRGRVNFDNIIRIAGSDEDGRSVSIAESNCQRARDIALGRAPLRGIRPADTYSEPRRGEASRTADFGSADSVAAGSLVKSGKSLPVLRQLALDNVCSPFDKEPQTTAAGTGKGSSPQPEGFIVTNPPYGRRLGETGDAERIYGTMKILRDKFPGWKFSVISDHPGFESFFGSKADSCREISNGAVQSYYYQYERL